MVIPGIIFAVVAFLNFALSFFVLSQNIRSLNNRFFALLSFFGGLWTLCNYVTGIRSTPFWLESAYAFGALVLATGLLWTIVITDKKLGKAKTALITLIAVYFFVASYVPNFIADRYDQIYLGVFTGVPGWGLIIYTLFYLFGAAAILVKLRLCIRKTSDVAIKKQLRPIFYGALITLVISALTSFILPSFSIFKFSGLDGIGFLIFLSFIAYAITKRRLFNIKVIATELITLSLWVFILIRLFVAEDVNGVLVEGGLLLVTIVVGILLIRSVIHEVSQREKIELLAADLEKANVRLTELDRQKSEFVSFATHQLRSPLTAMKGYASLLLEGDMGALTAKAKNGVQRIFESTNTLVNIVDDYLNISRIELGSMKYAFDTVDLKTLVEDVIGEIKPNIDKTGLAFSFTAENGGTDYRITADRDKLKQVIANVIDNALKYTPSGSIAATLGLDKARHLFVFKVTDTGVGIAPEVLPRLFQKFSRADNANKVNIRGTGLGLYVAKQMIEAHHGTIRAESAGEGKGSTFIVELEPLAKA